MRSAYISDSKRFAEMWPTSKALYFPNARTPAPGEIFRQPDLAKTMRAMAGAEKQAAAQGKNRTAAIDAVRDYFYRGDIAKELVASTRALGGLFTEADLANWQVRIEEPLTTRYRGIDVYKLQQWQQGPVLLQMLALLKGFDLDRLAPTDPDFVHIWVECAKLAYADREAFYGDPKFVEVLMKTLLH